MKKNFSRGHLLGRLSLRRCLPVLVWLGAVACVIGLFFQRSRRFQVLGLAQGQVYEVAATCTGRLKSVPVGLFDKVEQGQIVAILDTVLDNEHPRDELQARLITILAEIEHLTAQLIPTQETLLAQAANLETNRAGDMRRFSIDVETAIRQKLQLETLLETDRVMAEALAVEVKIAQELVDQEAIAPYELQKAQLEYNTLAKKIAQNQHLLEQVSSDLEQAQERRDEFVRRQLQHPSVDGALDVIRKGVRVQECLMEEVSVQLAALKMREALELKTPLGGVVSQIQRWPGEVVDVNDPILTVAQLQATEVVAYADEGQVSEIREGMPVELVKSSGRTGQSERSQVVSVGPAVVQKPVQLWRNPNIPERGRPFVVKVPPQMKLIIGERVGIRTL
jgi:multidrug resistance efflux pump